MNTTTEKILALPGITITKKMPIEIKEFTRDDLASFFSSLEFTKGAELGTAEGIFSLSLLSRNENLVLHSIDPYISSEKNKWSPEKIAKYEREADLRLKSHPRSIQFKTMSHDASRYFQDEELDFVYIDANHHYEFALEDMRDWWRIVRPGGIMAGHDWEVYPFPHSKYWDVKGAVNAFVEEREIKQWFVLGRNSKDKEYLNCPRSWMIVKES
jgi:hypothetical protein